MDMMQGQELEGDERLFVKFYMGTRENPFKSEEQGHPVFDNVPFVRIMVPGDKNTVVDTPATEIHKQRFSKVWERFQKMEGDADVPPGMPIREWPMITRGQAEELAYLNCFTVEQLAAMADQHGQKIMNFHELKRKAAAFLEAAKDSSLVMRITEENERLQNQITNLEARLAENDKRFLQLQGQINATNADPSDRSNRRK
jgi:hypothetical protein